MNHSYQIVTNEADRASCSQPHFVAQLANIYIEMDGKRIEAPYPNLRFKGNTYASAMLKANDAFKTWLANFEREQRVMAY